LQTITPDRIPFKSHPATQKISKSNQSFHATSLKFTRASARTSRLLDSSVHILQTKSSDFMTKQWKREMKVCCCFVQTSSAVQSEIT
jgi:hypothetical protein